MLPICKSGLLLILTTGILHAQDAGHPPAECSVLRTVYADGFVGMDFSPDGRYLVAAGEDTQSGKGQLTIWKIAGGEVVYRRADFPPYLGDVDVAPDGTRIAAGCLDGTVYVLRQEQPRDFTRWKPEATLSGPRSDERHKFSLVNLRFAPAGGHLATLVSSSSFTPPDPQARLRLYSCSNLKATPQEFPRLPLKVGRVRFLDGDRRLLVSADDPAWRQGEMIVLEASSGRAMDAFYPMEQTQSGPQPYLSAGSFDVSPDGKQIAVSGRGYLRIFTADSFQLVHDLPLPEKRDASEVCFSPDGDTLAAINDNRIKLWNVQTGRQIGESSSQPYERIQFSPDGRTLASQSLFATNQIQLWSIASLLQE